MKGGIYLIEIGDKLYVGSTINFINRKSQHLSDLRRGVHSNPLLQYSYDKYIEFKFSPIYHVSSEELGELVEIEQYFIDWVKPEFNINPASRIKKYPSKPRNIEPLTIYHMNGTVLKDIPFNIVRNTNLSYTHLSLLRRGKSLSIKGWSLYTVDILRAKKDKSIKDNNKKLLSYSNQKGCKNHNYKNETYRFFNTETKEEVTCTQNELYKKFNLDKANVSRLIKRRQKKHKNWILL